MLRSVEGSELRRLETWLTSRGSRMWGSACSGTESPQWCFDAADDALTEIFGLHHEPGTRLFHHGFSAEIDHAKQEFIKETCRGKVQQLFGDMSDLASDKATNLLTCKVEVVKAGGAWAILVGSSCKTASGLKPDKQTGGHCIEEAMGTTGPTFYAVRLIA